MLSIANYVGKPRIELGPHAPHACILPLYDIPLWGNYNKKIPSRRRVSRGWGLGVVMALPLHPLSESFSLLGIINLDVLTASGA